MNDLISVIVPVYQSEKYLRKCIESIIHQSYKNLEIILVDDGSTDSCYDICEDYAKKDDRIIVIHQENRGLSAARNVGIEHSNGNYIAFVDSDDFLEYDIYEVMISSLKRDNAQIVMCGHYIDWENSKRQTKVKHKNMLLSSEEMIHYLLSKKGNEFVWNKMFSKELFKDIRFPISKYYEDSFIMSKLIDLANKITCIDKIGYHYLQREGSICRSKADLKLLDSIEAKEMKVAFLSKNYPSLVNAAEKEEIRLILWVLYLMQIKEVDLQLLNKKQFILELLKNNSQHARPLGFILGLAVVMALKTPRIFRIVSKVLYIVKK